ncbi:MAG: NAD(P)H-quinone oxidoreductase subunit 3 [Candidatus Dichloromethanomonas elyunquensis]|nr:MAG: NAD(P)H-quinone oxidoreductase subunit 3 [Candidatus Dichloromethanomonas elyunquensis]
MTTWVDWNIFAYWSDYDIFWPAGCGRIFFQGFLYLTNNYTILVFYVIIHKILSIEREGIMLFRYTGIAVILVWGIVFPVILLRLQKMISPHNPTRAKTLTYECGLDTQGDTWIRFKISYFMYALIFVVFDVETVFLYPWAVLFQKLGLFGIIEMIIFMAILIVGFAYAWKEGALQWM